VVLVLLNPDDGQSPKAQYFCSDQMFVGTVICEDIDVASNLYTIKLVFIIFVGICVLCERTP
jgi:hypothetical protein